MQMKCLVLALSLCTAALTGSPALALSVRCEAEYGAQTEQLLIAAAPDALSFEKVNIGDRFRFQAHYLADRAKLKTYVYELRAKVPTLIHAAEYLLSPQECTGRSRGFGLNKVYSSDLEREMFFQCFAVCD